MFLYNRCYYNNHFYASMDAKKEHVINNYDLSLINVMMCNDRDNLFSYKALFGYCLFCWKLKIENTAANNFKTRLNNAHMGPSKDGQTVTQINVETCTMQSGWNVVLIPQKVHIGPSKDGQIA